MRKIPFLAALLLAGCLLHLEPDPPAGGPAEWHWLQIGSDGAERGIAVAINAGGDVVVAGATTGSLHPRVRPEGGEDIFLRCFSDSGEELWTRQYGTHGLDRPAGVGFDAAGNVYAGGYTAGDLFETQDPTGGGSGWLVKYTPQGTVVWTRQFGTDAEETVSGFAVDAAGNCYLAGSTAGPLYGVNLGDRDAFLACYGPDGRLRWGRQLASDNPDYPADDAATAGEAVGYAGPFAGYGARLFFARADATGLRWLQDLGARRAIGLAADRGGGFLLTGSVDGPGGSDAFLARADEEGRPDP